MSAALALLLAGSIHAAVPAPAPPSAGQAPAAPAEASGLPRRTRNIVVLKTERWIDTVRGTVKNVGSRPAQEVVLDVRLHNSRGTVLGTETVRLGPLGPGEQREFQLALPEKVRSAARWEITPRATFAARARKR